MNHENKIDIPFGAEDSELKGWEYTIPEGMEAEIKDGKVIVREKESEDEKIRRALIELISNDKVAGYTEFYRDNGITCDDAIAYLEKQKEPMPGTTKDNPIDPFDTKLFQDGVKEGRRLEREDMLKEQKPTFYPGDVIKCTSTGSLWVRCKDRDNIRSDGHTACIGGGYELASEEEAVQFFQELNENGYQWDCIKGRPMKKKQNAEPFSCGQENGSSEKPKNQWSEEDKEKLYQVINVLLSDKTITVRDIPYCKVLVSAYDELIDFLESLPARFNLQPKQEWSDEDETAFGDLMWCIEQAGKSAKDESDMGNIWFAENWLKNHLKSLRPQYHGDVTMTEAYKMGLEAGKASSWKPSEEQMKALKYVAYHLMPDENYREEMFSLYEQLKKL